MIRYGLRCDDGHSFESWFQGDAAFVALKAAGQLTCPVCGNCSVEKVLMAPAVRPARKAATARPGETERTDLAAPASALETAIAALKRQIEENSEYIGMNFASEARRIHAGDAPERAIHGEASLEEARQMIKEGLPVAQLPFMPARKVN